MDGAYVIKRLQDQDTKRRFPSGEAVRSLAAQLRSRLPSHILYRVFFYHADPYRGAERHPLTGERIDFGSTGPANDHRSLLRELEISEDFAVRRGEVRFRGWRVRSKDLHLSAAESRRTLVPTDSRPVFVQKGVECGSGWTLRHSR